MSRLAFALVLLSSLPAFAPADDPKPDPVEKALATQTAMAAAESYLGANSPAEAIAVLEAQLGNADGSKPFLALLRRAYAAEVRVLETAAAPDAARIAQTRRKLALLGGPNPNSAPAAATPPTPAPAPQVPASPPAATGNPLREARELFKQGNYAGASVKFAAAVGQGVSVNQDEVAAWAYCRVKVANDRLNGPGCDPATAAATEKDVAEALRLAPTNAELQRVGQAVLAVAHQRASGRRAPAGAPTVTAAPAGFETIETASFRVRFKGTRDVAQAVASTAEVKRNEVFKRWSGPPSAAWGPKCEIVLHPSATCYASMTGRPAQETGHAVIKLTNGRATERRIELRADDESVLTNALPRELTHVVLADLFPTKPPPRWAEEGMAVLAATPEEVGRYIRTLPRCAQSRQLLPVAALLEMKEFPAADRITGFYCESVSLTEYLVKLRGEQTFTLFLRDSERYGTAAALKRTYEIDGPQALEQAWTQAALGTARGQNP